MDVNVPEIRMNGFTEPWVQKKLGEICGNFRSGTSITAESIYESGEYPVYGGNGLRGYTNSYTHDGDFVLIGRQGALCGNITTVSGKIYVSEHAIVISENELSNIDYLAQLLLKLQLNRYSESTAQPGLSVDKLKKIDAIIPTKLEQENIGKLFRALDENIALNEQKLDGLRQLKKGYLQQMFPQAGETKPMVRFNGFTEPWIKQKLSDSKDIRDGTHDSPKFCEYGYPLVTSKNLTETGLDMTNTSLISSDDFELINKRSKVDIGDIIFGMIGTIGNPVIVDRNDFAIKNVALIKNGGGIPNIFLIQHLKSPVFENYIYIENTGNTQKFLSLSKIREYILLTPNNEEMTAIGNFFHNLDNQITTQTQKIKELKQLKTAYLQKMFV